MTINLRTFDGWHPADVDIIDLGLTVTTLAELPPSAAAETPTHTCVID